MINQMKLAIGCDDAAIEFKNRIKEYFENSRKLEFEDVGVFNRLGFNSPQLCCDQ